MSNFQTILVAIFLAFFVFAVLIFSGTIKIGGEDPADGLQGKVVIWGALPSSVFSEAIGNIGLTNTNLKLSYSAKDTSTYQQDLIEAFANDNGPDLFVITEDMIMANDNFIYKRSYTDYPKKNFTDSFIEGANIYLKDDSIIGLPILIDPIVLYYNKDILSNQNIIYPPSSWDQLFTMNSEITKRDNGGMISQSMIALGQYSNVNNVKDILATLLIQNDNGIVKNDILGYTSTLDSNPNNLSVAPAEAVLRFFMEFSNPSNTAYSWNRSFSSSLDMFTSGKLAFYIGRASELFNIESINPNLSFNVTEIPQIKDSTARRTFGKIYAVVINKKSKNLASAFKVAEELSKGDIAKSLSVGASLPPVSKALLADKPTKDPYLSTFFNSAIIARSWPDPDNIKSDSVFKEMIENILSNNLSVSEAISKANRQLQLLIKK